MRTLLVDADVCAFRASAATEGVFYFSGQDSPPAVDENLEQALVVAERDIEDTANKLKADRVIVCLTDDVDQTTGQITNFRCKVYPGYKQKRLATRRPSTLARVKDFYADRYECYRRPSLEADDCMGILSTHSTLVKGEKIIVSEDKDLQTIPGLLFNPKKDKKPRRISELEADRYFLRQALTGDSTDGYPGCPGIGAANKTFLPSLEEATSLAELWAIVVQGFESKGLTYADALQQARCARILRATDWDFKARKVRLWVPPASR